MLGKGAILFSLLVSGRSNVHSKLFIPQEIDVLAKGKVALMKKGVSHLLSQLVKGIQCFEKITGGKQDMAQETASRNEPARPIDDRYDEIDEENDEEDESDDSADEGNDISERNNGARSAGSTLSCTGIDFRTFTTEKVDFAVRDTEGDGMLLTYFPLKVSLQQSKASSVISVIMAYWFLNTDEHCIDMHRKLPPNWLSIAKASIRIGNMLFERARNDLPDRYMSLHESLSVLSSSIPVEVEAEISVSFDHNAPKHVSFTENILRLLRLKKKLAVVATVKERSSNFFFTGQDTALFMDTHDHCGNGTMILRFSPACRFDISTILPSVLSATSSEEGHLYVLELS